MAIGRTTKRNSAIWNEQFTARRAQEATETVGYCVKWAKSGQGACWNFSKPTGSYEKAEAKYLKRTETAIFVELWKYTDVDELMRRFCHIGRFRQKYSGSVDFIYAEQNPPYEIQED